jgi:hypothetical protein
MHKQAPAASGDAYVRALKGWRRQRVEGLRADIRTAAALEEKIKWGNLVYLANGPVLVIRAEDDRILFSFWRGKRLRTIEPRLKPGGKYEMATLDLRQEDIISSSKVRRLTREAVALNTKLGDPTLEAKRK